MNNSQPTLTITCRMYGWSKWGGGTTGIVEEGLAEWYCQVCGEMQLRGLPSYMFPIDMFERDYVRICTRCKAKASSTKTKVLFELRRIVRV